MKSMTWKLALLTTVAAAILAGCGGGSAHQTNPTTPDTTKQHQTKSKGDTVPGGTRGNIGMPLNANTTTPVGKWNATGWA